MAPQLATVDLALNAFYGYPMLSPTTRSLQKFYFFDSFGLAGFKRFILQDDAAILRNIFTSGNTSRTGGIEFETIGFDGKTAVGFLDFLTAFAKYNRYRKILNVLVVKDALQELNTSYCAAFCLYLLFNLFSPEGNSTVINERQITHRVVDKLIAELFYNEANSKRNSDIVRAFIKEYEIKGEFTQ